MDKISIIVPCYNEEESLPVFYQKITEVLRNMNYDYELIWIDDGSKDNTLSVMKLSAMYAGFCNADGDYVAVMDADMQDPPSLLPIMIDILKKGKWEKMGFI